MKSPTSGPNGRQSKPEHRRPMSCRGSDMQRAIATAVRAATPDIPTTRQSWRVKGVIAGDQPACVTLEAVIDERIAAGASVESVMNIAFEVVKHTREKLIAARPDFAAMVSSFESAALYETQMQGAADVPQMESFGRRCVNSLKSFISRGHAHRDALDVVLVAAQRAVAEQEQQAVVSRSRLSLGGRAS